MTFNYQTSAIRGKCVVICPVCGKKGFKTSKNGVRVFIHEEEVININPPEIMVIAECILPSEHIDKSIIV